MLETFFRSVEQGMHLLQANFFWVVGFVALLWVVQVLNTLLGHKLNVLGIYPRHAFGLVGILFSPFLHKDFQHLFVNSIPLFILLNVLMLYGFHTAVLASCVITVMSGTAIWLFGRRGIHIGSSALVFGYFGFAIGGAIYAHNIITILAAVVCLFYLGGLLTGVFPTREQVSWEGHLMGLLSGFLYSYFLFT